MDTIPINNAISTLPVECLEMIIALLCDDLSSLYNLLLVSRQVFQLTVPVLYKSPFALSMHSQESGYRSTLDRTSEWDIYLGRTRLLTKLLIQNLQINHLGEVPKHAVPATSLIDDSNGFEKIEPLLPPVNNSWSFGHQVLEIPSDWTNQFEQPLTLNDWGNDGWDNDHSNQQSDHHNDLIDLNEEWDNQPTEIVDVSHNSNGDNTQQGTGLLMDYFHFYINLDHRSIRLIIREIYPGAGRRQYERYLEDIDKAILKHNPKKIEMIHIKSPLTVVPYLQEHSEQFERLSSLQFQDSIWTSQELDVIYKFLLERRVKISQSTGQLNSEDEELLDQYLNMNQDLDLDQTPTYQRCSPIRHVKYETRRSYWDQATLASRQYNPIQLLKLLGPGLETIDTMYWYKSTPVDLETLDVSSLRTLKVGIADIPKVDHSYSRPEFLSRCRELRDLETFSSSKDMFCWAVKDWNEQKRMKKVQALADEKVHSGLLTGSTPLVQLQCLRILVHTDQIAYSILRDAFYGFRNTLKLVEVISEGECTAGEAEWMDRAQELLSGIHMNMFDRAKKRSEAKQGFDEEEYLDNLTSISSKLLLVRWEVPHLSTLDLTGPIAAAFDIGSLLFMPSLHTVCFSISSYPSTWIARGTSSRVSDEANGSYLDLSGRDMTHLPFVAPPSLRRVMIRGPWPEITDQSIQEMISAVVNPNISQEISYDGAWGNQLLEFTVLGNERVIVPTMIQLACQMDNLQVMGMSLTMPSEVFITSDGDCHIEYPNGLEITSRLSELEELEAFARDMILRAQIEMSWVDIGDKANHLGRRNRRDKYYRREWV